MNSSKQHLTFQIMI